MWTQATDVELRGRLAVHTGLDRQPLRQILADLQEMLHRINPHVRLYLQGRELAENGEPVTIVFDPDMAENLPDAHPGTYADGVPASTQIQGLVTDGSNPAATRFSAVMPKQGPTRKISTLSGLSDGKTGPGIAAASTSNPCRAVAHPSHTAALHFVLFHPSGSLGYSRDMLCPSPTSRSNLISIQEYYRFR